MILKRINNENGMTYIEVIISLFLIALLSPILLDFFFVSYKTITTSQQYEKSASGISLVNRFIQEDILIDNDVIINSNNDIMIGNSNYYIENGNIVRENVGKNYISVGTFSATLNGDILTITILIEKESLTKDYYIGD